MNKHDGSTIHPSFVRAALEKVIDQDMLCEELLRKAGLTRQAIYSDARVTIFQYGELLRSLALALDDEFLGQDSRRMKSGSFAMLCHATVACETLEKALHRSVRFFNLLLDDIIGTVRCRERVVSVTLQARGRSAVSRRFGHELYLMMLQGVLSWAIGRRIELQRVDFCYPAPAYWSEYALMYCENTRFNTKHTRVLFSASYLRLPVIQNSRTVKVFLQTAPEPILVKYRPSGTYSTLVRRYFDRRRAEEVPTLTQMADILNTTTATLRRQLFREGTSYRQLKDRCRRRTAMRCLRDSRLSMLDIALEAGFAEPSTFYRAFRRWTGALPRQFRSRQPGKGNE